MKKNRSITVVVPAYNAEAFLAESIQSILDQTVLPDEVLIVDNLSTDRTAEIARSFDSPVRTLFCDRAGVASARNMACREAQGDWLAFLDADDLWSPNTLELFVSALDAGSTVDILYGLTVNFHDTPDIRGGYPVDHAVAAQLPGAMLIRRTAFERVGSYNEQYTLGCVIDWAVRAQDIGLHSVLLPEVVLHRRIHNKNITKVQMAHNKDYAHIIKAALDRRRKAAQDS